MTGFATSIPRDQPGLRIAASVMKSDLLVISRKPTNSKRLEETDLAPAALPNNSLGMSTNRATIIYLSLHKI